MVKLWYAMLLTTICILLGAVIAAVAIALGSDLTS
jgi:hypothetical protein